MAKKTKRRTAWSYSATVLLSIFFYFVAIVPARAPRGGKNSLGGRTIASVQEEEFDHRLLNLQLCYGVRFDGGKSTPARRRVCKALVVHALDKALAAPGAILKAPVEFVCDDTAFPKEEPARDFLPVRVHLKPNAEFLAIQQTLDKSLESVSTTESNALNARETCEFLTDCKWAMRPQAMSLR
jgi:hypothetical protein